jgi:hypothetical protein
MKWAMLQQTFRPNATVHRSWIVGIALTVTLAVAGNARGQTSSSSRPLSATVVSTYIVRNGELALLVLWRGSPGWYSGGGGNGSGGGGGSSAGRETGSFYLTFAGRTFSIDLDYTARVARLLEQEISLADTNVVLVDDVDRPVGARVVGRRWVDPKLPETGNAGPRAIMDDPAIATIRRDPEAGAFLQCDIPVPPPAGNNSGVDPKVLIQITEYVQALMTQTCRAAIGP